MKHEDVRRRLMARREQLLGQVGKIEADMRHAKTPLEKDSQERSVQLENDDVLAALDEAGRKELGQIKDALQRLDDGTYGQCARCGEPISEARLTALPTAKRCIQCADVGS